MLRFGLRLARHVGVVEKEDFYKAAVFLSHEEYCLPCSVSIYRCLLVVGFSESNTLSSPASIAGFKYFVLKFFLSDSPSKFCNSCLLCSPVITASKRSTWG